MAAIGESSAQTNLEGIGRKPEGLPCADEELYRLLADTTPLPVIVVDLDGIVLYANQRAAAIFEVPWEQTVGHYMPDFYIDPQARAAFLDRLRQHGRVAEHEMLLETATGRKFWALISAGVMTIAGRPAIFTVFNDITERRRMEEELRQRAAQLEEANRAAQEARLSAEAADHAKSVFLANMSHELRTPLNAVLGFSQLLAQDPTLTAAQRDNIVTIHRSGELLLQMINDILDMAKIEAGHVTVEPQELDLHRLLDSLGELFRLRAADKGLAFALERPPDLPHYIVSDERKVRRILVNLLANAVKFTDRGAVTLRARVDPDRETDPPALFLVCVVQDTGPGIAPEYQEAVFQPFVQLTRQGRSREGTGLGLPISRRYARLLGGDLTLVSTGAPGEGARLELRIPITVCDDSSRPVAAAAPPQPAAPAVGQPVHRLLVVEDQPENRMLLETILEQWGFAVRTAQDGEEALRLWAEWQPHLIWMDMYMPGLDGLEVTRRIKAAPQGAATVIVALTASTREEDQAEALAAGCDAVLRKPFQPSELADVLARHLGVRPGQPPPPVPPGGLDLTGRPADWVAGVRQAAIAADGTRLLALAEEVRDERPALATLLRKLVAEFDYQTILAATEEKENE